VESRKSVLGCERLRLGLRAQFNGAESCRSPPQNGGMPPRNLNVLDAAELAAERLNRLIDRIGHRRLLHVAQMRDSAQSVSANIREGFGRATRAERDNKLRLARGVAEETLCRLRANLRVDRITKRDYWPVYNLFRAVIKMLDELLNQ
jgi:four helix bundle protein